jgi:RimJ/RimL family protein N-acetyltransferase
VPFVPAEFVVPAAFAGPGFRLEPLGPEHNARDYEAWSSSIEHIRRTSGFTGSWPREMSLEENRRDLERHARDFRNRAGFTYTALDSDTDDVIGCVYIYPAEDGVHEARVHSWVRASRADLDAPLRRAVAAWLAADWPFDSVDYAGLDAAG